MSLDELSDKELEAELARRKKVASLPKPCMLTQIDAKKLDELRELCLSYLDSVSIDAVDDDMEHYIFETAIEVFYGDKIWGYINKRLV